MGLLLVTAISVFLKRRNDLTAALRGRFFCVYTVVHLNDPIQQFTGDTQASKFLSSLEEIFPPVTPTPSDDLPTIMYRAGQRSVIEYIQQLLEN